MFGKISAHYRKIIAQMTGKFENDRQWIESCNMKWASKMKKNEMTIEFWLFLSSEMKYQTSTLVKMGELEIKL